MDGWHNDSEAVVLEMQSTNSRFGSQHPGGHNLARKCFGGAKKVKASHNHYLALGPDLIQVTISYPLGGWLPLLSARPAVTFPDAEHHFPLAGTKLYCLVTQAHTCEQLAQGCYTAFALSRI